MKLKAYIDQFFDGSVAAAARSLKKPQQTVDLWVKEKRIPRKKEMLEIKEWTGNLVQPNDFYLSEEDARANGLHPPSVHQEAAA